MIKCELLDFGFKYKEKEKERERDVGRVVVCKMSVMEVP